MTTKQRKKVIRKVKKLLDKDERYGDETLHGPKEAIQDEYIKSVCEELGFTIHDFYFEEGKKLETLLSVLWKQFY